MVLAVTALAPVVGQAGDGSLIVRRVSFEGSHAFPSDVLAAAISTTNSSWFAASRLVRWVGLGEKRRFDELELRRDIARLRLFFQIHGYLEAQVDTSVVRTVQDAYVTFRIREGEPVLVESFEIRGLDSIPDGRGLTEDLPLKVERPFDRTLLLATADTVQTRLRDRGYPEARVLLDRREVDREHRSAFISLVVEPGQTAVVGEIHVQGTHRIDSAFVRRLLATQPGREYRQRDIAQSQLNLYRSELFRFAAVALDTLHFVPGARIVPLTIQVIEGPLHRARAAIGYGTNDCFRTGIGWTARNAFGHGQIFDVSAQVSKIGVGEPFGPGLEKSFLCSALKDDSVGSAKANYNVSTTFHRPVFLSPNNSLTLAVFAERRSEFAVYLREDIGGSATLTRETSARIPVSLTYRPSYGFTDANAVSFCAYFNACTETDVRELRKRRLIATATLGVQRTRVNNPLDPSRGSAVSLETTHSSKLIGSSEFAQFTRFIGDAAAYREIGSSVLAFHIRGGIVVAPTLVLDGGASNFVPPEQRFYAGGPNDVRGFNRNQLGPLVYVVRESVLDTAGMVPEVFEDSVRISATGGNTIFVANLEARVPSPILTDRLRFAVFVDAGTVWERGGGPGTGPALRITPGAGIRYVTPLGPARLDVAYNPYHLPAGPLYKVLDSGDLVLHQNSYEKSRRTGRGLVFQFSVGQAF